MSRLRRSITRWRHLPGPERFQFCEACCRLFIARLQTRLIPFHRIAVSLNALGGATEDFCCAEALAASIRRAARVVPFRALCFEQALALHAMAAARRMALSLHYGLGRDEAGSLRGHVWVECAGKTLLGGEGRDRFERLATFPQRGLGADPLPGKR